MKYLETCTKGVLYKEWDRYNSTNPYSASMGAEELAHMRIHTLMALFHIQNVSSERHDPEKYIPMCVRRVRNVRNGLLFTQTVQRQKQFMHYIHVKDVADAMLFLLNNDVTKKKSNDPCK